MKKNAQFVGAVVGASMLAVSGAAAAMPALAQTFAPADAVAEVGTTAAADGSVASAEAVGTFSFDQNAVTPTSTIKTVFQGATAAVCNALPDYGALDNLIAIGAAGADFQADLNEMAESDGIAGAVMACICAANMPGGGAIANAEVSGVTLESIAQIAGV